MGFSQSSFQRPEKLTLFVREGGQRYYFESYLSQAQKFTPGTYEPTATVRNLRCTRIRCPQRRSTSGIFLAEFGIASMDTRRTHKSKLWQIWLIWQFVFSVTYRNH